ncbi:MAG: alpha-1,2-fucosyltransferase [Methylotenera sp.]|nr:alpha-1,2-fucosyltransferase [Methylotenera sp.]
MGSALKLDTGDFTAYSLHQGFELDRVFNCHAEIATDNDLALVLGWQRAAYVKRALRRPQLKIIRYKSYIVEPHFNYWNNINQLKDNVYLEGYWQSERYFHEFSNKIREDFTFKLPFSKQNTEIADRIGKVNALSLHVRRGDYANNSKTLATHGLCSLDYYRAAIQLIIKQVENPHFFVFSDDIAWVKNNLKIDFPHLFIDHNLGAESYNDMRLMSLCKHNIIANSSFSWWAAWLNTNPQKIVIAPQDWFSNKVNVSDLIPHGWIRI